MDDVQVKFYSGHVYAERPMSFTWEGIEFDVIEIEKTWLEPGLKYFQVRTKGSKIFKLCYNEALGQWSVTEQARS